MAKTVKQYLVKKDSREQQGWSFPAQSACLGTEIATLKTGDYTLAGLEDKFVIERKQNSAEIATNLFQPRFERELCRLDSFENPYIFIECDLFDIIHYPENSGIPRNRWSTLRVTPQLLLKRLHEIQIAHPGLRIWFVGQKGRETASSLFKRIVEHYGR